MPTLQTLARLGFVLFIFLSFYFSARSFDRLTKQDSANPLSEELQTTLWRVPIFLCSVTGLLYIALSFLEGHWG